MVEQDTTVGYSVEYEKESLKIILNHDHCDVPVIYFTGFPIENEVVFNEVEVVRVMESLLKSPVSVEHSVCVWLYKQSGDNKWLCKLGLLALLFSTLCQRQYVKNKEQIKAFLQVIITIPFDEIFSTYLERNNIYTGDMVKIEVTEYSEITDDNDDNIDYEAASIDTNIFGFDNASLKDDELPLNKTKEKNEIKEAALESLVKCPYCGKLKGNDSTENFVEHVKSDEIQATSKQCLVCNKTFSMSYLMRNHVDSFHLKILHTCPECGVKVVKLKSHIKMKHNKIQCPQCQDMVGDIKQHLKYMHTQDKQFCCQICQKAFKLKAELKRHEGQRKFPCEECQQEFCKNDFKVKHLWDIHSIIDKSRKKRTVEDAIRNKTYKKEKRSCPLCGKIIQNRQYKKHMMAFHKNELDLPDELPVEKKEKLCPYCGKNIVKFYNTHIRVCGEGSKETTCQECGKFFELKRYLERHMKSVHLGITYTCPICGKEGIKNLGSHRNIFHGEKKPCDECGELVKDLKQHIRFKHERLLRFHCDKCSQVFVSKQSLDRHCDRKHSDRPVLKCDFCRMKFIDSDKRIRHIQLIHKDTQQKDDSKTGILIQSIPNNINY